MTQEPESEIPQERQVQLRQLATLIVGQLPKAPHEARFTLQSVEELLHFTQTGEWLPRARDDTPGTF